MPRDTDRPKSPRRPPGGRPSGGRDRDRAPQGERSFKGGKPSYGTKKPYAGKKDFGDRKTSGERKSFGEKKAYGEKKPYGERKAYGEKKDFGGGGRKEFGAKRAYGDGARSERPRFSRDDRREGGEGARPYRPRPERFDRDAEGGRERPRFKPREDHGERPAGKGAGSFRRDDRKTEFRDRPPRDAERAPRRFDRGERREGGAGEGRFGDKPYRPRPERFDRDAEGGRERPRFKPRGDRGDRPQGKGAGSFRRDDRKAGFKSDFKPGGYRDRPERDGERAPRRFDRDERRGPRSDGEHKRFDRPERGERATFARPRVRRDDAGPGEGERRDFGRKDFKRDDFKRKDFRRDDARSDTRRSDWQEHPRSEGVGGDEGHEARPAPRRPAFGGRGAYRERPAGKDRKSPPPPNPEKTGERIAKRLARAGMCSRRDAEEWITQGRVAVNGRVLTSPALDVTERDVITVDGQPLPERERTRLFLYHKPRGLMTTHDDPEGRPTVFDNLPADLPRVISIGRLDFNTEGLLLLTNDGGLARALELPETGWLRRYRVRAHGSITQPQLDALRDGIEVDGVKYGPIEASLERDQGANVWIVFAIREGKNREVRNVLAHLGLEVNRLIRVSYGPFQLAELAEGAVEEVRTRVLRSQLGEKLAALAHADFGAPASHEPSDDEDDAPRGERRGKPQRARFDKPEKKAPRPRSGLIEDRKGRRVLVERSGEGDREDRPYKRPKRAYHGKRDRAPKDT